MTEYISYCLWLIYEDWIILVKIVNILKCFVNLKKKECYVDLTLGEEDRI